MSLRFCFRFFWCICFRSQIQEGTCSVCEPSGTMLGKDVGRHRCVIEDNSPTFSWFLVIGFLCQSVALFSLCTPLRWYKKAANGFSFESLSAVISCFLLPGPTFLQSWSCLLKCYQLKSRGLDRCWRSLFLFFLFFSPPLNHKSMTQLNPKVCNYIRKLIQY